MSARTTEPELATGLPPGVHTGPLGARLVAQLVDAVVPVALLAILLFADLGPGGIVLVGLLIVAWLLLVWWRVATRAASPGMLLMKLQLVGLRDGRPIGWRRFAVREVVLAALTCTVVGLLAMLFLLPKSARRQGWHDLLAGSVVIQERALAPALPRPRPVSTDAPRPAARSSEQAPATPLGPPAPDRQHDAVLTGSGRAAPASRRLEPSSAGLAPRVPAPSASAPALDPDWAAVLDDGRALAVTGLMLLGRNPQGRPGEEDAELIKVTDESRTVSKTHLALGLNASGLYVMDRGSTNGSTLTNSAGVSSPCYPGEVVSVPEGSIVSFGDHWLRVERHVQR